MTMFHFYNAGDLRLSRPALISAIADDDPEAVLAGIERVKAGPRQQATTVEVGAAIAEYRTRNGISGHTLQVRLHEANRTWRDETAADRALARELLDA